MDVALRDMVSDGFGHVEGMVGLGDLRRLFQPKFCDSLILWEHGAM